MLTIANLRLTFVSSSTGHCAVPPVSMLWMLAAAWAWPQARQCQGAACSRGWLGTTAAAPHSAHTTAPTMVPSSVGSWAVAA